MLPPRYDDCILYKQPSLWNFVESYFYWDGVSDKKGWLKYRVERIERGVVYLHALPHSSLRVKQVIATALKITSLATLVLPLILWLAKQHYRKQRHFVIEAGAMGAALPERNLSGLRRPAIPATKGAMDTHIARHFASVRVDAGWVLQDALRFFRVREDKKVLKLPQEAVQSFLVRHAVVGRVTLHTWTNLEGLAKKIAALKGEGMYIQKSYHAMLDVLDILLKKEPFRNPGSEPGNVLRAIRVRIDKMDKDRPFLQQMFGEVESGNLERAARFAQRYAEQKIAEAKSHGYEKIGAFIEAGWRRVGGGHGINVELLHSDGKWRFIIAQAGSGSRYHRHDVKRDQNQQPVEINLERIIPIKNYEYRSETQAKEVVKQIALYRRGPASLRAKDGSEGKGFYALFKDGTEIDEHNIPFRPSQIMPNCALRSQEEALFYICQRLGCVDAANTFQNIVEDKIIQNAYPALKAKISARGPKETIKPLCQGDAKVVLFHPKVRHVLPMREGGGFVIGTLSEVPLPWEPGFSRQQAEIVRRNGKNYVNLHARNHGSVEVFKANGIQKILEPQERIEIQSGDLLKCSGSYTLAVT